MTVDRRLEFVVGLRNVKGVGSLFYSHDPWPHRPDSWAERGAVCVQGQPYSSITRIIPGARGLPEVRRPSETRDPGFPAERERPDTARAIEPDPTTPATEVPLA